MEALVPFFVSSEIGLAFDVVALFVFSSGGDKKRREASNRKLAR